MHEHKCTLQKKHMKGINCSAFTYDKLVQGRLNSVERIVIVAGAPFCVGKGLLHLCLKGGKVGLHRGNGGTGDKVANVLCERRVTIDEGIDKVYQLCIGKGT